MANPTRTRAFTPEQFRQRQQAQADFWQQQASNDPTNGGIDPERAFDCYPHPEIGPEHLGSDTLLAYPEDLEHKTRYLPRLALLALADIWGAHADACAAASLHRKAQGRAASECEVFTRAEPEHMAALMRLIAQQMDTTLYPVDSVAIARAALNQAQGETA